MYDLYRKYGFSTIPVKPQSKEPKLSWKEFRERYPTQDELSRWFGGGKESNIGIVTGSISGIVVLDVDGPKGVASLASMDALPPTPCVKTGKGMHYYFKHPGFAVRNFAGKLPGLDLRGDGGYVVAPPSVHENGSSYKWELGLDDAPIADMPGWLLKLVRGGKEEPIGENDGSASLLTSSVRDEFDKQLGILASAIEGERNPTLNRVAFELGRYVGAGRIPREMVEEQLTKVATRTGLTKDEIKATIKSGLDAGIAKPKHGADEVFEILDSIPEVLDRPLRLIDGKSYLATWLPIGNSASEQQEQRLELFILDEAGNAYGNVEIPGVRPVSELPFIIDLPYRPRVDKLLSPTAFKAFLRGGRPNPARLFGDLANSIDAFVCFENSLADQKTMCEMTACSIMSTYALDAFNVVGYPWPTGERGSGKTQFMNTFTRVAYLGKTVTSGSSFATLRDEAHCGATLGFDDCENIKAMESNTRELLLAGNTRGSVVSYKVESPSGGWETRDINNFAVRLFTSIDIPDEVLKSRTILIPLICTSDRAKTRRSPVRDSDWPVSPRDLVDRLWTMALVSLPLIAEYDGLAAEASPLEAREHDVWRPTLAMACWLEHEHGVDGLFGRISKISEDYTEQSRDEGGIDLNVLLIMALDGMLTQAGKRQSEFKTAKILDAVLGIAARLDGAGEITVDLKAQRVGMRMGGLGFKKSSSHGQKKSWIIDRDNLDRMANRLGVELSEAKEGDEERGLEVLPF